MESILNLLPLRETGRMRLMSRRWCEAARRRLLPAARRPLLLTTRGRPSSRNHECSLINVLDDDAVAAAGFRLDVPGKVTSRLYGTSCGWLAYVHPKGAATLLQPRHSSRRRRGRCIEIKLPYMGYWNVDLMTSDPAEGGFIVLTFKPYYRPCLENSKQMYVLRRAWDDDGGSCCQGQWRKLRLPIASGGGNQRRQIINLAVAGGGGEQRVHMLFSDGALWTAHLDSRLKCRFELRSTAAIADAQTLDFLSTRSFWTFLVESGGGALIAAREGDGIAFFRFHGGSGGGDRVPDHLVLGGRVLFLQRGCTTGVFKNADEVGCPVDWIYLSHQLGHRLHP